MDDVTKIEHERLTLHQLEERKTERHKQRSVRAEFTSLAHAFQEITQCLKMDNIPVDRVAAALQTLPVNLVNCTGLVEELGLYEARRKRLVELDDAVKDYL